VKGFFSLFLIFSLLAIMAWTNVMASSNPGFVKEVPVFMTGFTIQKVTDIEHASILLTYAMIDTYFIETKMPIMDISEIQAITLPINSQEVGYRIGIGKLVSGHMA